MYKLFFLVNTNFRLMGGVEKHVLRLIEELKTKYKITIISLTSDNKFVSDKQILSLSVNENAWDNHTLSKIEIWTWFKDHKTILSEAEIVHAQDVYFWIIPYKLQNNSQRTFVTFHGWETKYPIPIKNKVVRKVSEIMADGNICIGDFITKWYGTKPDIVSYGGVDKPKYKSAESNKLLFLGRLDHDTGFDACVRLYDALKKHFNWSLEVAGDGPEKIIAPTDANLLGFVPDPEKYTSQAKFVFTTGYLGMLEAFSYRKLVLASYANPVKKDYLLMHPMARNMVIGESAQDISDKLKDLSQSQIDRMIEAAFTWSKDQTWAKLTQQHEELWGLR